MIGAPGVNAGAGSAASSASVFTFGEGADGKANKFAATVVGAVDVVESFVALSEIAAEESIASFAVSPVCGTGKSSRRTPNIICHLRCCEQIVQFGPHSHLQHYTDPKYR